MNAVKILNIQKMGMDFYEDKRTAQSDCTNFRLRAENITAKDGTVFGVDFSMGVKYAFTDKNGKKLRKPKVITETHLCAEAWHYKTVVDGAGTWEMCYHYRPIEQAAWEGDYSYTIADILKLVNSISRDQYTSINFIN